MGIERNCYTALQSARRGLICGTVTHQALASRVYHPDEKEADREPRLRVLHVEIAKGDEPSGLAAVHDGRTHTTLDAEQEEGHGEVRSGDDVLEGICG